MRGLKISNEISKQMTAILSRTFPGFLISVTKTVLVNEGKTANVFVSIYSADQDSIFKKMIEKRISIRKELASKMKLRRVPDLRFNLDKSLEYSQEMSTMISKLNEE